VETVLTVEARPGAQSAAEGRLTRRALLRGAVGGATVAAAAGLPGWVKPARALQAVAGAGIRGPDSLPYPHLPAGAATMPHIEHIVVLMMENHSFDNLLGMVPYQVAGRAKVDGFSAHGSVIADFNPDHNGRLVYARPDSSPCQLSGKPRQDWNASHEAWNHGRLDGFVRASGPIAMRFWDQTDLPFTYSLVKHFPVGERFFSSVLAQTYPNRRFLFTGTASGTTATDSVTFSVPAANGTIFDRLDEHGIDFGIYYEDLPSWLIVPDVLKPTGRPQRQQHMDRFYADAAAGHLPRVSFLDPNYGTTSEENPQDIQVGERFMSKVVHALLESPTWNGTALFITYDEHGGYYDHVPPPRAIRPDNINPLPVPGNVPGTYDRYGFRVPLMVVSPWARKRYASRVVQDHTSITAFIEHKWNLPAMTFRDANAHAMADYFDFRKPHFHEPPRLHRMPGLEPGLRACRRAGLTPPLKPSPGAESDITRAFVRG
jgi:phospholipase C